jgi:hypothetical protein
MAQISTPAAAGVVETLADVLREEQWHYAALLALAEQQGQLMTSHDLEGLQANAHALSDGLAAVQTVRQRREQLAGELMGADAASAPRNLSAWLQQQPLPLQEMLLAPALTVRRTAGELARTNEMNRRLANFCLDLVEEEAALLRRCLLADPAGCYDRGAQPARNEQGGVLKRQA